jgi:D-galactarolactone isomerase
MSEPAGLPPGACDCHVHVFEPRFPLAPTATFTPPHAPVDAYRAVQRRLGLSRVVVVQPTGYGFDNRCTLDAVDALGAAARAVVVVAPDTADDVLARLDGLGVRGVRYMMLPGGVLGWDGLEASATRIAPFGWHVDLQLDGRDLPLHEARLRALPAPLVIDHIGKFLGPTTVESPAFASLCRLLDHGRCWVKLSAPYESSRTGPPAYVDVAPLARHLVERHAERCLWASNWPHPNVQPPPSEAALVEWSEGCFVDRTARQKILVDNPAALYRF